LRSAETWADLDNVSTVVLDDANRKIKVAANLRGKHLGTDIALGRGDACHLWNVVKSTSTRTAGARAHEKERGKGERCGVRIENYVKYVANAHFFSFFL